MTAVHAKTCTLKLAGSLFPIVPEWKEPKSLSLDERWFILTLEHYLAKKSTGGLDLESFLLRESKWTQASIP